MRQLLELFIYISHVLKRLCFLVCLRFSLRLLKLLRRHCYHIVFTKGSPLSWRHILHWYFMLAAHVYISLSKSWINILKSRCYLWEFKESAWVPEHGRITSGKCGPVVTICLAFAFNCMKLGFIILHEDGMIEYMLVLFDIDLPKSILIQLK